MEAFLKLVGPFLTGLLLAITAIDAVMAVVLMVSEWLILGIGIFSAMMLIGIMAEILFG